MKQILHLYELPTPIYIDSQFTCYLETVEFVFAKADIISPILQIHQSHEQNLESQVFESLWLPSEKVQRLGVAGNCCFCAMALPLRVLWCVGKGDAEHFYPESGFTFKGRGYGNDLFHGTCGGRLSDLVTVLKVA